VKSPFWRRTFSPLHACFETKPFRDERRGEGSRVRGFGGEGSGNAYLNLSWRHLEPSRKLFAPWRVRFLVSDEYPLQDLELRGGGALAGFDGIGDVCVEHLRVDFGGIHAGWNQGGNVGTMASWCRWREGGRRGRVGRVTNQHNP